MPKAEEQYADVSDSAYESKSLEKKKRRRKNMDEGKDDDSFNRWSMYWKKCGMIDAKKSIVLCFVMAYRPSKIWLWDEKMDQNQSSAWDLELLWRELFMRLVSWVCKKQFCKYHKHFILNLHHWMHQFSTIIGFLSISDGDQTFFQTIGGLHT